MSRILLLIVIVLWMCRSVAPSIHSPIGASQGTTLFVGGLLLIVLFIGLWSRVLARNIHGENVHRSLQRFHKSMWVARLLIPVWFGVAIFGLGWGTLVDHLLGPIDRWPVELPGMLIGTMPAFVTWMALWWAQFPADLAIREQNIFAQLDDDLPVHSHPSFWNYFSANVRLQVLFTVVPVALIIFIHDIVAVVLWKFRGVDLRSEAAGNIELVLQLLSIGLVVLFAPEILRRVLATERLPASSLRTRLEELCRRSGLRYREILLWKTNHSMGNAAVMGLIPQMRYILLSDVLLETMTDRQIEAVFAHEIGHVKHWHMGWYVVLVKTFILMGVGPGQLIIDSFERMWHPMRFTSEVINIAEAGIGVGAFFLIFGYLSRRFERQADVYAARMMEANDAPASMLTVHPQVGPRGAATFSSALHRVAVINNIPLSAPNFTHGSIADRMRYLESISENPALTLQFDRSMFIMYVTLVVMLIVCGTWVLISQWG